MKQGRCNNRMTNSIFNPDEPHHPTATGAPPPYDPTMSGWLAAPETISPTSSRAGEMGSSGGWRPYTHEPPGTPAGYSPYGPPSAAAGGAPAPTSAGWPMTTAPPGEARGADEAAGWGHYAHAVPGQRPISYGSEHSGHHHPHHHSHPGSAAAPGQRGGYDRKSSVASSSADMYPSPIATSVANIEAAAAAIDHGSGPLSAGGGATTATTSSAAGPPPPTNSYAPAPTAAGPPGVSWHSPFAYSKAAPDPAATAYAPAAWYGMHHQHHPGHHHHDADAAGRPTETSPPMYYGSR